MAYARGRHAQHPGTKSLSTALTDRDVLFVSHIASSPSAWNPAGLRTTVPAALTAGPQTLNDAALAAFFDVGLSALAHATASAAGYPAGSTTINAIALTQLLEQDVDADGIFDGRGVGGLQLATEGVTPLALNSQFLRIPLAKALDQWIQSKSGNASGIAQGDLVSSGVYVAISQDRSDLFGAPPDGLFNPTDRVPPEVSFASEPPKYVATSASTLVLTASATDPSGVAKVWCASDGAAGAQPATQGAGGSWSCKVQLGKNSNQVTVWAEDAATPVNSGQGLAPPYMLTRTVIADSTAPSVSYVAAVSYYDERGATLGMNGNVAAVPAVYNYASGTKTGIDGAVYKLASRLGWSTAPTAAELEGANPGNIPFLQFSVPYNAQTDAPIAVASYTVSIPGLPDATGDLWPSARTDAGVLYYDLPLSSNLIPALSSVSGPASVTVALAVTDAAGNTTMASEAATGGTCTFHVIGPPVGLAQDANYASANDVKSTYIYTIGNGLYEALYNASTTAFFPENVVRLAHYFVSNPSTLQVAFTPPALGSWSDSETWTGTQYDTGTTYRMGSFDAMLPCSGLPPVHSDPGGCENSILTTSEWFPSGGGSSCGDPGVSTTSGPVTSGSISTLGYYPQYGIDVASATKTGAGRYIVPAANGGTPGILSLYVVRPRGTSRSVSISGAAPWQQDIGHELKYKGTSSCLSPDRSGYIVYLFEDYWYYQQLTAASETWSGSFQPQTVGLSASGSEFGEMATAATAFDVGGSLNH